MDIERLRRLDAEAASYIEENFSKERIEDVSLRSLFIWMNTPQGHDYWRDLEYKMEESNHEKEKIMNKETAIALHRLLWNEIAEKGIKKHESSLWRKNGGAIDMDKVHNKCFLCQYVKDKTGIIVGDRYNISVCKKHCPLDWPTGTCFGEDESLFRIWEMYEDCKTTKQIAELPEKQENQEKLEDKEIFFKIEADGKVLIGKGFRLSLCNSGGYDYRADGDINGSTLIRANIGEHFYLLSGVNKGAQRVSGFEFDQDGRIVKS